jgi:hypothetical protein
MPRLLVEPDFGLIFEPPRYSDFSPISILEHSSPLSVHAVIRFSAQSFRWCAIFPSHFAPPCIARWMRSRKFNIGFVQTQCSGCLSNGWGDSSKWSGETTNRFTLNSEEFWTSAPRKIQRKEIQSNQIDVVTFHISWETELYEGARERPSHMLFMKRFYADLNPRSRDYSLLQRYSHKDATILFWIELAVRNPGMWRPYCILIWRHDLYQEI